MKKSRIVIFASGNGTNAEAVMRYFQRHDTAEVIMVLSNNPNAFVLERAKKFNIPGRTFTREQFNSDVLKWLTDGQATHIVLAGFLLLMPSLIINAFPDRIINIHPSLLPKFSGKGMYGMNVHEAVRMAAEEETGITIHIVNDRYDEGEILFQATVGVLPSDSTEEIARKVHALEYEHFPEVIEKWIGDRTAD